MKKYLYLLLIPFALTFSCKEPEPEPEPVKGVVTLKSSDSIVLSDEGDSKQVTFSATVEWTTSASESWVSIAPKSGQPGDAVITVTAGKNEAYDPRTATVTIKSGEDTKTVNVTQKQKGALLLTESTISVAAEGGKVTITAKANSNVTATIATDAQSWISNITTKGLIDYVFEFEVQANAEESPRSGQIVFSNEAGSETITIQQEGAPVAANITGTVTCGGAGVPDVLVSDGVNIVKTDADGNYRLQSDKKWKYVFITIPSGYEAPLEGILPRFWKPLQADAETEEQVNFELVQASNDNYTLLVLGDMHLARRTGDLDQFEKVAEFMKKEIAAAPGKVYCLTLGDMTWDMYWLANNYGFADYLQTMNGYFTGIPFFHTMGNHDNEMEVAGDYLKAIKYTENLAPGYYSFNLGKIHYIVMDDMDFTGVEAGEDNRSKYAKNFTAEQLEWLRKDLSYVDKGTPIFVTAHEPLARPSGLSWGELLNGKDADLDTFIGIFDGYNVQFLSGHTHNLFNKNWTDSFTEHNSGAVCASWWWSGYITPGIHIAQDGAPGGYTIWTVNGTECTHYYQAALQSRDYQFRAYDMNEVKATITEDLSEHTGYPKYYNHIQGYGENIILVNVWDYDDDWKVEISENGTPLEVEEVGVYDPLHIYAMTIPRLNKWNTTTFSTAKWRHFFQATASAPDTPVSVKITDRYGNVFTEEMARPKAFKVSDYKNEVMRTKPEAEFVFGSSSSLIFGWTVGGTAAEDGEVPYKLELFKDAACTDLEVSFDIPADASCWGGNPIRFTFGGLQPSTTYWFKVTNSQSGEVSEPVQGTTADFTVVDPSTVTNAGEGDVILAEDFSEVAYGPDEEHSGAGFFPAAKLLEPVTGSGEHDGSFVDYKSTARRVYGDTKVTSDKRLFNWGFFGNSAVYAYNGHLRVCTTSSGARTHIVSPALSGIPENMIATVDVTVTACSTSGDNDVAVFVNDRTNLKLALAPDQNQSTDPKFSSQGGKYTGASLTNGYALEVPSKQLTTKTVRIEGVTSNSCLLIGSYENVDTKNRFWLSDVKVQIVSLRDEETVDPNAKLIKDDASFLEFVSAVAGGDKTLNAKVKQDINLSSATVSAFETIEDYAGTFDGNSKTISGLTKPMFNDLKGTVKNLTLNSTLNITADQLDLGIIANVLSGTAEGCTSKGSVTFNVAGGVTGEHHIAGMFGKTAASGATVTHCTNDANVTNETANADGNESELMVGGVLGTFWGEKFTISDCTNTGTVTNNGAWNKDVSVGGIIGQAGNGSSSSSNLNVSNCTNSGSIINIGNCEATNNVGGVIGWIRFGTYTDNTNTGAVSNTGAAKQNRVGGVIGYLDKSATFDNNSNEGKVSNSGAATDINYVGGLLGRMQTDNTFLDNSNSGLVSNSGDATNYVYIGGIVGYLDKSNAISDAGSSAKYKLTNSGDIENSGSAKNICIGGLFGRNSSGYFNMTGSSSKYSTNSGSITDNSGPAKSNGGDLSIGGIAGYTTTGIKTQYARNSGNIIVTGDKGNTSVNVGGIGGWISNASFNFNNCRNSGNITVDCTTTASLWVAGIVGCPKPNTTIHYYWRSNAIIDTHAATVGGENYTAGLMGTVEGTSANTFTMYGHRVAGTVWGSKTTTGLFCCTKTNACDFSFQGGTANPNMIAPGTVRKDNVNEDTVNEITDVTIGILAGGEGSTYDISSAIEDGQIVVQEW